VTQSEIAARLAELERVDRLEEAADLAERSQLHAQAAGLWEKACRFERAAEAALAAGEPARALGLAARAADRELEARAIAALVGTPDAAGVADQLSAFGQHLSSARLRSALGDHARAAADFERAGLLADAAFAFERARDPRNAARCLELALAADPEDHGSRLALGELLFRNGRLEAAIRALQRVPAAAPERAQALALSLPALSALGLDEAARQVQAELSALGTPVRPAPFTAPPEPAAVERILFGRYRVVSEVATTPTARVVEAVDRVSNERVAVKIFAPSVRESGRDALERFEREARALGQLRHPAIVPLRAYLPDAPAVVLAWMEGGSLADLLARGVLSPARAVEVTLSVLGALGEAHRRGILHRDIKPANVLFDGAGGAHLADFGTAHVADSAVTVTAGVIGTLAYMAPEQRAGNPATTGSDIYGAGALLWHALTGAPPDANLPFLSDELDDRHRSIARVLIAPEAERPNDSLAARTLLSSLAWPRAVPVARAPQERAVDSPPLRDLSLRLVPRGDGVYEDTLLAREVHVLPADPETLARVLPFARAGHPGLASVLVHRPDETRIWIEALPGDRLDAALTEADRRWLEQALAALHRAGGAHGAIDREHVVRRGGMLVLKFPLLPASSEPAADLRALAEL
jgi:eukaryotic-like serine/threonine-protein kinase